MGGRGDDSDKQLRRERFGDGRQFESFRRKPWCCCAKAKGAAGSDGGGDVGKGKGKCAADSDGRGVYDKGTGAAGSNGRGGDDRCNGDPDSDGGGDDGKGKCAADSDGGGDDDKGKGAEATAAGIRVVQHASMYSRNSQEGFDAAALAAIRMAAAAGIFDGGSSGTDSN